MSSPIFIDPENVSSASASVRSTYDQIETLLGQVNTKIQELEASFQGTAGNALQALFANYHRDATNLNSSLNQIADALGVTASSATDLNQQITKMFTA
jgi:WXG100 family type VII secretion target